jgi:hypothetical protein
MLGHFTENLKTLLCDRGAGCEIFVRTLDKAETLIATNDGCVVDLLTCTKQERISAHMFSMEADFRLLDMSVPDQKERVDDFHEFVSQIYGNDEEKTTYCQKVFGYALTCNHEDRHVYFHVGCGSNGKTSLDECFQAALGRFHRSVRSGFLAKKTNKDSGACSPDIMSVMTARMISCNETERGAAVDDSRVKLLADGGRMSGRQLYQQEQMINLVGKCMVYSNFMLKMGMGDDIALCDRVIGIQYKMRFVSEPDPSKPHELLRSSKRVLKFKEDPNAVGTWLCIGAAMAMKDIKATGALHRPQIINDETNEELSKINILNSFFRDNVIFHPSVKNVAVGHEPTKVPSDWHYDKQELWGAFKFFTAAFGGGNIEGKFDMSSFNGCVQRYFANTNTGVVSLHYGSSYYWAGIKAVDKGGSVPTVPRGVAKTGPDNPYKPAGPDPKDPHFPLFGATWTNKSA